METIRVLNLFTIMNRGGAETMVMNYYRNIDRTKVQFDFLVHREEKGAYEEEIEALGGRIYRMIPLYPQNFGEYKKRIREFFQKHKEYQIIHSHMSELGYFAFREAKRQGIPVRICHAHNAPHGWDMKMFVRTYFKKRMMPYLTHMFMCGMESGEWLFGKKNRDRFIQMNNAIDTKKFIYDCQIAEAVRKELGIENQFVVGHVGRFNEQKNHEFLIDIFYEVVKMRSDSILLLVGDGNLKEKIEEKVERLGLGDKVLFLGVREDIPQLMQAMDVFLFPSLFEGLPVTLVEAQASGLPILISDRIPKECIMTPTVSSSSLEENAKQWADHILKLKEQFVRTDMSYDIKKAKYDVIENAKWLEEFYLNVTE